MLRAMPVETATPASRSCGHLNRCGYVLIRYRGEAETRCWTWQDGARRVARYYLDGVKGLPGGPIMRPWSWLSVEFDGEDVSAGSMADGKGTGRSRIAPCPSGDCKDIGAAEWW
jgi:hypothetical protein